MHQTIKSESILSKHQQRGLSPIWHFYTDMIRARLHNELTVPGTELTQQAVDAFSSYRAFIPSEDVNHIITLLFKSEETSDLHDQVLSIALTGHSGGSMGRKIGLKSFGKLLVLMRKRPSEELDRIVLSAVRGCYLPDAVGSKESQGDVVRVVVDDDVKGKPIGLYADVASMVDEETVRFLFSNTSQLRSETLRYLLAAASSHRALLADLICGVGKDIGQELAIALFDGMSMALSIRTGSKFDWVRWAQEKEMEAIKILHKKLKKRLVKEFADIVAGISEVFKRDDLRAATFALRLISLFPATFTPSLLDNVVELLHAPQYTPVDWELACTTSHYYSRCFVALAKHENAGTRDVSALIIIWLKLLRELYAQKKKDVELGNAGATALVDDLVQFLQEIEGSKQVEVVEDIMRHAYGQDLVKSYLQSTMRYRLGDPAALGGLTAFARLLYLNEVCQQSKQHSGACIVTPHFVVLAFQIRPSFPSIRPHYFDRYAHDAFSNEKDPPTDIRAGRRYQSSGESQFSHQSMPSCES